MRLILAAITDTMTGGPLRRLQELAELCCALRDP